MMTLLALLALPAAILSVATTCTAAERRGWVVVNMKQDWSQAFSPVGDAAKGEKD